jgi:hypothetical protein
MTGSAAGRQVFRSGSHPGDATIERSHDEQQRDDLRLARGLLQHAGPSVGLGGIGLRPPVGQVARRAAHGLDALGHRVVLVRVLAPGQNGERALPAILPASGAVELVLQSAPGKQVADEIRRWRANLEGQFSHLLWDLTDFDVLGGVDAPALCVVESLILVARSGAADESMVAAFERTLPPGIFRGLILSG